MKKDFKTSRGDVSIECIKIGDLVVPKNLYRYRDINEKWHRDLFESNEVYFTSFEKFNDPFDSRIEMVYTETLRIDLKEEMFVQAVAHLNQDLRNLLVGQVKNYLASASDDTLKKTFQNSEKKRLQHFAEKLGFLCMTPIKDNIVMWAHYANNHTGICVGFDPIKLIEATKSKGEPIEYSPSYPEIPVGQKGSILKLAHIKSSLWDYEIEYRLSIEVEREEQRKIVLPIDTLTEVYFGLQTSEEQITYVVNQARANNPNVKFYSSAIRRGTFQIMFQQLQI